MWWLVYGFAFSDDQSKHITHKLTYERCTTYLKIDEFVRECHRQRNIRGDDAIFASTIAHKMNRSRKLIIYNRNV